MEQTVHENFSSRAAVKTSSNRSFGLVFAAVFALIAAAPLLKRHDVRWWSLAIAAVFLCLAFFKPEFLAPLNRVWTRFGLLLHKIVSPVVLGLMYFIVITPFALILRVMGKRPLALGFDRAASTYWIIRKPPGPPPRSMTQQF